jgi:hypothetical protein
MATASVPIQRPDTYQRLPEDMQLNTCEQQPVHTFGLEAEVRRYSISERDSTPKPDI